MDALALGHPKHALDIDFDLCSVDADDEPLGDEAAITRFLHRRPQFTNDLTQRGTGLFFVRTAPQQADEPLPALLFGFRQREVAKDSGSLPGTKFDWPAIEPQAEASDQRYRQTRS